MSFPSDLEIARAGKPKPLKEIAAMMGIGEQFLEPYGTQLAKISLDAIDSLQGRPKACLLYTSPSPRDGLLSRMPSSA